MALKKGHQEELINQAVGRESWNTIGFLAHGLCIPSQTENHSLLIVKIHQEGKGLVRDKSAYPGELLQVKGFGEKKEVRDIPLFWANASCDLTFHKVLDSTLFMLACPQ